MKTEITAADLLHERGYKFAADLLAKKFTDAHLDINERISDVFEISGVFMIDAYNAGREGKPLASVAPWLIKE